jgi:TP901 family phage tail tape measure protein
MAGTVKDVTIDIKVKSNLKQAEKGFDDLNKNVENTTKNVEGNMSKMDNSIKKFGTTLIGAFAIKEVVGDAVRRITEFEQSIANLGAITGASGGDLKKFEKAVLQVSANTGKGASDIAKAFQLVGSAKPELLSSAQALGAVTEQAVILSQAGGLEVPAAAEALTKAMNQFGVGAEEAANFTDILATSQQKGTATIAQLSESLKNVGAVANSAGLNFQETNAALQALAKGGLSGAEAGTGLRGVLLKLQKEGIGFVDGQFDINEALTQTSEKFASIKDPAELATLKSKLFGTENVKTIDTLLAQQDVLVDLNGNLLEHGNALEQAEVVTSTFKGEQEKLDAAYGRVILQLENGNGQLSTAAKNYIVATTNLLGFIEALEKGEGVMAALNKIGADFAVNLGIMSKDSSDFTETLANNAVNLQVLKEKLESGEISQKKYNWAVKNLLNGYKPLNKVTEENTAIVEENTEVVEENSGAVGVNANSIKGYEERIKALNETLSTTDLGSDKFFETKRRISELKDELGALKAGLSPEDLGETIDPVKSLGLDNETIEKIGEGEKKKTEVIVEEMKERNAKKREETAADFAMNLEMERAFSEAKIELDQQNMLSVLDLAAAVASAAGDSQEAQIAALTFQKLAAFASIVINTQTAIAAATAPPPIGLGPILGAGLVPGLIARGAIQGGIVLATAIPQLQSITQSKKLKDGEVLIDGPGTETSDSIPALLSRNESVINAKSSKKHAGALRAINDDRFEQWLESKVMNQLLYREVKKQISSGSKKTNEVSFPDGFRVTNPNSISGPIAEALNEQTFLNRNSY